LLSTDYRNVLPLMRDIGHFFKSEFMSGNEKCV
jgi:hypothetical protein